MIVKLLYRFKRFRNSLGAELLDSVHAELEDTEVWLHFMD